MAICTACESNDLIKLEQLYRSDEQILAERELIFCENCHLTKISPMLDRNELDLLNDNYWERHQSSADHRSITTFKAQMRSRIKWIEEISGSILDVGAGHGFFKQELDHAGMIVDYNAVEFDKNCWPQLKALGANTTLQDLPNTNKNKHDLVFLSHVLEHISDPKSYLTHLSDLMHSESRLYIEVPNQDHLYKKDFGTHLFFYTPESLGYLLANSGFTVSQLTTSGAPLRSMISSEPVAAQSLLYRIRGRLPNIVNSLITGSMNIFRQITLTPDKLISKHQMNEFGDDRRWIRCIVKLAEH